MITQNTNLKDFFKQSDKNITNNYQTTNILKSYTPVTDKVVSDYIPNQIDFTLGGNAYLRHVTKDVERISKYLASSEGLTWILKQEGLQLMNPKRGYPGIDPIKIFNPIKLLSSIPQGVHYDRYGKFNHNGEYEKWYPELNTSETYLTGNRLIKLYNEFNLGGNDVPIGQSTIFDSVLKFTSKNVKNETINTVLKNINERLSNNVINELSGIGGPNSFYGLGTTLIRKSTSGLPITESNTYNEENPYTDTIDTNDNVSQLSTMFDLIYNKNIFDQNTQTQPGFNFGQISMNNSLLENYNNYQSIKNKQTTTSPYNKPYVTYDDKSITKKHDYFKDIDGYQKKYDFNESESYYQNWNMAKRLGIADNAYVPDGTEDPRGNHPAGTDAINMGDNNSEDLIKVKIGGIQFRAFITGITDNFTSNWSSTKYVGRPDDVYTYEGMKREFSFNLIVPLFSTKELEPVYMKLNKLAQFVSPIVSKTGQMSGQVIPLKVGMWFAKNASTGLPVIINSLNYSIDDEHNWDVIKEVPMVVSISLSFNVIDNYSPSNTKTYFRGTSK